MQGLVDATISASEKDLPVFTEVLSNKTVKAFSFPGCAKASGFHKIAPSPNDKNCYVTQRGLQLNSAIFVQNTVAQKLHSIQI